ncbi:MAG: hypothetical protein HY711_03705 [Candidatus Melainabacteria bacterium]|nr:hypothetical protein [Candidatus Melainabacteria bacterium]
MSKVNHTLVALAMAVRALFACPLVVQAQSQSVREYEWIIEIQTEELPQFLNYPGSTLKPMVKATISYSQTTPAGLSVIPNKAIRYEDFYYKACTPLGCKRLRTFGIPPGDGTAIRLKHKLSPGSSWEACAGANAIVRILLDAYLNGNPVATVLVPASSFSMVVQELHRENFYAAADAPPDEPVFSSIVLYLESEPSGNRQTMNYVGRTED